MKVFTWQPAQMAQVLKKFQHEMELLIYSLSISNVLLESK